jgi:hypothetical protein
VSTCWGGIGRQGGGQLCSQQLKGAPQPAGTPVQLALGWQVGKQVGPAVGDLDQPGPFAEPDQQATDQRDGQQLAVGASRGWAWPSGDGHLPGPHGVIDQHIDMDEQLSRRQHRSWPPRREEASTLLLCPRRPSTSTQPTSRASGEASTEW